MVNEKQINQWLKDGTINQSQAKKMLADSSQEKSEEKSNKFISIIATIGAVLIFIGFAWLIAKNWHQIPNVMKVMILVLATLTAFVSGVLSRQYNHKGVGRSLIALGALLYTLSVFLIAQIYATPSGLQGYAWLLLLCWPVIILTAYFLDSKENLVISLLTFFPWATIQYTALASNADEGMIFGFVLIYLSAGALLYGLTTLHNSIRHRFTNVYRIWTVFYFLLIFYILSFQSFLSILSDYSFKTSAFPPFLILFVILCFFGFMIGTLFAVSKSSASIKESTVVIAILAILTVLILLAKVGEGAATGFWSVSNELPTSLWLLWILNNFVFIGVIILMIWYGQRVSSAKIVNLALFTFILEIITRYIGFWADLRGYFAFSVLAILGGLLLIFGAWFVPKWRRKLLEKTTQTQQPKQQRALK